MFTSVSEIVQIARDTGSHFFDPDTMRYFSTRLHGDLYGGRFFVTSERDSTMWGGPAWNGARRYTVRVARYYPGDERLQIDTVGEFGEYDTREEAHRAAQRVAGLVEICPVCKSLAVDCVSDCVALCEGHE